MDIAPLQLALTQALRSRLPGLTHVEGLRRLTGGATKQTWSFDGCGDGQRWPLILQRTTEAAPVAGGPPKLLAHEDAALMTIARAAGVPAPEVVLVLPPDAGLGSGYVTQRVEGETLGRKLVHDASLAGARAALAAQCGTALATLHRLPVADLPFLRRLSPAQELAVYGSLQGDLGVRHPALAFALRWVREHLPAESPERVVHADFRSGNLIVGPEGLRCVLDWEIARVGDPMQDLGVLCMRSWRFGGEPEVGGFGSREALYAAYEAAGGLPVDPRRVRFWEAFANLKWAIACVRRGLSVDAEGRPASMELCAVGRRLEEPLWDFLSLLETAA